MPANSILIDSSILIALFDKAADEYEEINAIAKFYRANFLVPQVILTEVLYLVKRETGTRGAIQFLEEFNIALPKLQDVTIADLQRSKEIMQHYASANLDFVDCCIMALAERLSITQVFTLDRRNFSIFRPKHVGHLELLP